jgi:hypothetical protein
MNRVFSKFDAIVSLVGGGVSQIADSSIVYHDGQSPPSDEEVNAEVVRLQEEYDALQYQRDREPEYPLIADQLDYIYHNGIAKWKSDMVKPVKDAHPKP